MHDNPFAPPTATADSPEGRGLVFSEEGVRVVSSLATWMRGLSTFYYVGVAFLALGACGALVTGSAAGVGVALGFSIVMLGLITAAIWLRSAASGFERGVYSDDEMTLGQGFRNLRAYLILMGIISILSLGSTILEVM
ncbi:hypothetical protein [Paraliomyxa miuraensis]|uniref:hypothetical protein n=1 Tax=Paraliomyxa miuraensis TaxID=376150 RepID=UPI00225B3B56|nr:hypothetical protein [Paraliomyxa miuraensis]MCX4243957.1 hypothetical protein [Paraliomyxa miuraensis]